MKNVIRQLAVSGLLALAAGAASADVTVNYIQPERFSDLPFAPWEREAVLKDLTQHFAKLGAQLPPGQNLRIDGQRPLWIAGLLLAAPITLPLYWWKHIWNAPFVGDHAVDDEVPARVLGDQT